LQYFLFAAEEAVEQHGQLLQIDQVVLMGIFNILYQINPLCQECHQIGSLSEIFLFPGAHVAPADVMSTINVQTHHLDISAIVSDRLDGNHVLQIVWKGQLHSTSISRDDPKFEALAYPILFPYGEDGWSKQGGLKFMDYITSRMLMPEDGVTYPSGDGEHMFPSNRFQLWHRLGQVYHCDQISRMIDDHLAYQRYHANKVARAVECEEQEDAVMDGVDDDGHEDGIIQDVTGDAGAVAPTYAPGSAPSFLSDRFHGSRRNLKKKAINALHLVSN
jgi:hypothetical protein